LTEFVVVALLESK